MVAASSKSVLLNLSPLHTYQITGNDVTIGTVTYSAGSYYKTNQGVLYRLKDNGKATLVACPATYASNNYASLLTSVTDENGATYTVDEIEAYAFTENANIKTIEIPSTITAIGAYAFYGCINLETVNGQTDISDLIANLNDSGTTYKTSAFFNTKIWNDTSSTSDDGTGYYVPVGYTEGDTAGSRSLTLTKNRGQCHRLQP